MNSLLNSDDRTVCYNQSIEVRLSAHWLVGTMQQVIDEGPIALAAATLVETAQEQSRMRLSIAHGIECKKI
jgi:hypothetical protein